MLLPILFFTIEPPNAIGLTSFDLRSHTLNKSEIDQYANQGFDSGSYSNIVRPVEILKYSDTKPTSNKPTLTWPKVPGAVYYEIEFTSAPPENPNDTKPSQYRIGSKQAVGFDCYDDEGRSIPGTYYWRVRGLNDQNDAVGVYSDAQPFIVNPSKNSYAATLGDSITHGGGAISYSPSDWEYDFQTYLEFPVVNLGKSGDTSQTMAARFDEDVLPYKPKFIIILGGTNSLRHGVPANTVIDELTIIKNKCLANGIRPIFLTLLPINPSAIEKAFNQETAQNWQGEFKKVNNFIRTQEYYIDREPQFFDNNRMLPNYYAIDGLHPDIEGKQLMAKIINKNLESVTH